MATKKKEPDVVRMEEEIRNLEAFIEGEEEKTAPDINRISGWKNRISGLRAEIGFRSGRK